MSEYVAIERRKLYFKTSVSRSIGAVDVLGGWNIRRQNPAESTTTTSTSALARSSSPDSTSSSLSTTTSAQAPATLVRGCLKAALDQVKSAVLRQENELVNQPAHILALIDRQMDLFLKSHFQGEFFKSRDRRVYFLRCRTYPYELCNIIYIFYSL